MNKKIAATLAGVGMAVTAMGAPTVLADDSVTLVYAELNSMDSTDGMYASYFKDKVEELTNGSVKIDIQASGVLGNETEVLDGMISMSGTVDIARVACYTFGNYGCSKSALMGLPFVFESRDHFWNFAHSETGEEILGETAEKGLGVTGLFYVEDGFRSFFFKDPVNSLEEIAGKKIRVSQDQIMTGMVESFKASPTVVSFNELYTSLQSGVVDGAEQPIAAYATNAFNEVAPNVILDEHTLAVASVVIADTSLDKLTDEQIEALKEAGKQTEEYCAKVSAEEEEKYMNELKEKGVNFVEVEDKTPWRDACADVISQFTAGVEDTYQSILDLTK